MDYESNAGRNGHSSETSFAPKSEAKLQLDDIDIAPLQSTEAPGDQDDTQYIQGIKFYLISVSVAIMMFVTNLEVPVVITALISITDDLGGFDSVSWVVASYLLGYVAVIVIFAKFSDIFGRKLIFLLSTAIFIIFSAACSAAQTMIQLIVFRAFQGIGGGGCFSLCTIIIVDLVPPEKYTKFVTNISVTNAVALLLGPIVGGAIAANTTWRWIFIINVPIALPAFVISLLAIPKNFPHQNKPNPPLMSLRHLFGKSTLARIDIPGTILILCATLALTAGFEEADKQFPWRSGYVISLLTVGGVFWLVLLAWERHVTRSSKVREPILPWRFMQNREMVGVLLSFVFLGGPTVIAMFTIPQRFQLVYGTTGLEAGVRLIPFTAVIPISAIVASSLAGKAKVPPIYLLLAGSCLQVVGFALLGTLPSTLDVPPRIYGFEIIAGWGCGINFSLLFIIIPWINDKRDHAVGLGAGSQFRFIGSSMVLAISTSVFNSYVRPVLETHIGLSNPDALIQVMPSLPLELQESIRYTLAEGYNRQILVLCVSAALQIPSTLLMWKKQQLRV